MVGPPRVVGHLGTSASTHNSLSWEKLQQMDGPERIQQFCLFDPLITFKALMDTLFSWIKQKIQ